jgi:putative peptidoglycan lipid II flippase
MKSALFMTIPSAAFIAVLNLDVVKAIYKWSSSYTDQNAQTAATFLLGFCSAIVTATVIHVFNQAFYAIGKNWFPLIAGGIGLVVNPAVCSILISLGAGPLSLSLAYSFTNICQMIMLSIAYCRQKEIAPHGILKFLLKSAVCVAVMTGVVYLVDRFFPAHGGKITQLAIVAVKGGIALVVYFAMALIFRMEEATYWIAKIKRMFKKGSSKKAAS